MLFVTRSFMIVTESLKSFCQHPQALDLGIEIICKMLSTLGCRYHFLRRSISSLFWWLIWISTLFYDVVGFVNVGALFDSNSVPGDYNLNSLCSPFDSVMYTIDSVRLGIFLNKVWKCIFI